MPLICRKEKERGDGDASAGRQAGGGGPTVTLSDLNLPPRTRHGLALLLLRPPVPSCWPSPQGFGLRGSPQTARLTGTGAARSRMQALSLKRRVNQSPVRVCVVTRWGSWGIWPAGPARARPPGPPAGPARPLRTAAQHSHGTCMRSCCCSIIQSWPLNCEGLAVFLSGRAHTALAAATVCRPGLRHLPVSCCLCNPGICHCACLHDSGVANIQGTWANQRCNT